MKRLAWWMGLAAALVAGCSDQGPRSGELSVRLATPRTGDRAILFVVIGRQSAVAAPPASGYRVFSAISADGDTAHVVVVAPSGGGVAAGEIARISVPDLGKAGSYVARVLDVATATYAVDDTAGVSLSFAHP